MKIIHAADLHLGSAMNINIGADKIKERRAEVRLAFNKIIDIAVLNDVKVIMLSGDVFDSDRPKKKDKEFFYSVIKNNPQIDFLYMRGNHDLDESFTESYENLKTFKDSWTYYDYGNVTICGIESSQDNAVSMYSTLNLNKNRFNVVMLHSQISSLSQKFNVNLSNLRGKNIDYLALGHYHTHTSGKLDERGIYAYSGCIEGRGFDETGEKGIVLLDVSENGFNYNFVKTSCRIISKVEVDVTGCASTYEISKRVVEVAKMDKSNIYRIELYGELNFDADGIEDDLQSLLSHGAYYISIKDKTTRAYDKADIDGIISLKSEFIKVALSSDLEDDEKKKSISLGLSALKGREIDL